MSRPQSEQTGAGKQEFSVFTEEPEDRHVWGIDITYIKLSCGWMYLAALIDWFSRYIVEWEIDQTMEIDLVLNPVRRAFGKAGPEIFNSDYGSQFTSLDYITLLNDAQVKISMDGKGRAIDNIFTEWFRRSLKYEGVYLNVYEDAWAAG